MLKIITRLSLIILAALTLSLIIDTFYRKKYNLAYKLPQNILIKPGIKNKYQIVSVGNSHAENGLTFANYKLKSISLASVAQSFEYDTALLKMYKNQIAKNAIIIINVSPISFSQKKPDAGDSFAFSYYDGRLSPFVIPNLKLDNYLESQIIPFTRSIWQWRDNYQKEVETRALNSFAANWPTSTPTPASVIMTKEPILSVKPEKKNLSASAEFEQAPVENDQRLHESVIFMVNKWKNTGDFGKDYFEANSKDLETLLSYSKKNGWRPVLVSIPISKRLQDGMEKDFLVNYVFTPLKKTDTRSIDFIDFVWYDKFATNAALFNNSDHLSEIGKNIYSHYLLEELIKKGYLPKEANDY